MSIKDEKSCNKTTDSYDSEDARDAARYRWMRATHLSGSRFVARIGHRQKSGGTRCPMPDDVCADCGYRCGEEITEAEMREMFGGPAREIVRTPEEEAALDRFIAYVEKNGHLP